MSDFKKVNSEIKEIKSLLIDFIKDQKKVNDNFNKNFNILNENINILDEKIDDKFNILDEKINENFNVLDKKIDKVQYYLEETVASNSKLLFEEDEDLRNQVNYLNKEIYNLNNIVSDLMTQVRILQQKSC